MRQKYYQRTITIPPYLDEGSLTTEILFNDDFEIFDTLVVAGSYYETSNNTIVSPTIPFTVTTGSDGLTMVLFLKKIVIQDYRE